MSWMRSLCEGLMAASTGSVCVASKTGRLTENLRGLTEFTERLTEQAVSVVWSGIPVAGWFGGKHFLTFLAAEISAKMCIFAVQFIYKKHEYGR